MTTSFVICFKCAKGANPMSYVRVMVNEGPLTSAEVMRLFNKNSKPLFEQHKKDKTLKRYSVVQVGDHKGF